MAPELSCRGFGKGQELFLEQGLVARSAQSAQGLVTKLADAFVGYIEVFAHFPEGLGSVLIDPVDTGQHPGFAGGQAGNHFLGGFFDTRYFGLDFGVGQLFVAQHFGIGGFGTIGEGRVEGHAALTNLDQFADIFVEFVAAGLVLEGPAHAQVLVGGQTDQIALLVDGTGNVCLDPPDTVGNELEASAIIEAFDGPNQTHGAFADQVGKWNGARAILDCHLEHETHIGGNEFFFGAAIAFCRQLEQLLFFHAGQGPGFPYIFEVTLENFIVVIDMHARPRKPLLQPTT